MHLVADRVKKLRCRKCDLAIDPSKYRPLSSTRCARCNARVQVPAMFDQFELLEMLGKGTSGNVFKAYNPMLKRYVAVKVLADPEGVGAEAIAEACIAEARALASLNHSNVVQIYTIGNYRKQDFIAMELVEGGSAQKYLQAGYQMNELHAMQFAIQTARGLSAAYEAGLIHMDVKPANILLCKDTEEPKLIDFGAAQFVAHRSTGHLAGTPYYVAPEVIRGRRPDFKADIYSLGATLFHLFTGRPPFEGKNSIDVIKKRMREEAPSMLTKCDHVNAETAEVIAWMLQGDPDRRYDSYGELIEAFEAVGEIVEANPIERAETFWFDELIDDGIDSQMISTHFGGTWAGMTAGLTAEMTSSEISSAHELAEAARSTSVGRPLTPVGHEEKISEETRSGAMIMASLVAAVLIAGVVLLASLGGGGEPGDSRDPTSAAPDSDNPSFRQPKVMAPNRSTKKPEVVPTTPTPTPTPKPHVDPPVNNPTPAIPPLIPPGAATPGGLIAHWRLNGDHKDVIQGIEGKTAAKFVAGRHGQGLYFNGKESLVIPAIAQNVDRFTMMLWAKIDAYDTSHRKSRGAIFHNDGHKPNDVHWLIENKALSVDLSGLVRTFSSFKIEDGRLGRWVHLALTFDRDDKKVRLFFNGQAVHEASVEPDHVNIGPGEFFGWNDNRQDRHIRGALDDIRIYNRAMSQQEIASAMGGAAEKPPVVVKVPPTPPTPPVPSPRTPRADGLAGHWPLATPQETSGRKGKPAQLVGATFVKDPERGMVVSLDSNGQYVDLGESTDDFSKGLTLALWAKPKVFVSYGRFIGLGNGEADQNIVFVPRSNTSLVFRLLENGERRVIDFSADGPAVVEVGKWQHFAVTYSPDGQMAMYKDGKVIHTGKTDGRISSVRRKHIWLGRSQWARDSETYLGLLSDVRIYERPLSEAEIAALVKPSPPSISPPTTWPVVAIPATENPNVQIKEFWLVEGDSETTVNRIRRLVDGDSISLTYQGKARYIAAMISGRVGSVVFTADGNADPHLESVPPYTFYNRQNSEGDQRHLALDLGPHAILAVPFRGRQGKGERGVAKVLRLKVVSESLLAKTSSKVIPANGLTRSWKPHLGKLAHHHWLKVVDTRSSGAFRDGVSAEKLAPTGSGVLDHFEVPKSVSYQFAQRLSGYLHPPQTGAYEISIESNGSERLYVSTDENPQNVVEGDKQIVHLEKGKVYYVEAWHVEKRAGNDWVKVSWKLPDGQVQSPIPGSALSAEPDLSSLFQKQFVGLMPSKVEAKSGAALAVLSLGAIAVENGSKTGDVYTVTFDVPNDRITALRLVAMADEALPSSGPGLGFGGSFRLNELKVSAGPMGGEATPVVFSKVTDDGLMSSLHPSFALDGKSITAWGQRGRSGARRMMTMHLAKPLVHKGGSRITVTLDQTIPMGRFRVAATSSEDEAILATPKYVAPPTYYKKYLRFGGGPDFYRFKRKWVNAPDYVTGGFGVVGGEDHSDRDVLEPLMKKSREKLKAMRFTVPPGNMFRVTLLFVENRHGGEDRRLFDVTIEGKEVVKSLDIFKVAKGLHKFHRIEGEILVNDGILDVEFKAVKDDTVLTAITVENIEKLKWVGPVEPAVSVEPVKAPLPPSTFKFEVTKPHPSWTSAIENVAPGFSISRVGNFKPGVTTPGMMKVRGHHKRPLSWRTHPVAKDRPCVLERVAVLPADKKTSLLIGVTHHDGGDFQLVVRVNGTVLEDRLVGPKATVKGWMDLKIDLSAYAGQKVKIEIENKATDSPNKWAYWSQVKLVSE